MHNSESVPKSETFKLLRDTNRSPNLGQRTRRSDSQQKREPVVLTDDRVKIKESEKKDKRIDLEKN